MNNVVSISAPTYSNRQNATAAARAKLGKTAKRDVDFLIAETPEGRWTWSAKSVAALTEEIAVARTAGDFDRAEALGEARRVAEVDADEAAIERDEAINDLARAGVEGPADVSVDKEIPAFLRRSLDANKTAGGDAAIPAGELPPAVKRSATVKDLAAVSPQPKEKARKESAKRVRDRAPKAPKRDDGRETFVSPTTGKVTTGKNALILNMAARENPRGATLAELVAATGWTTFAASGFKRIAEKAGVELQMEGKPAERRFWITL
jgi:hypothetical protein